MLNTFRFGRRVPLTPTSVIRAQIIAMGAEPAAPKPKVLLIDDLLTYHKPWKLALMAKVSLVHAFSIEDALDEFGKNPDVALIVMDSCLGKGVDSPNTLELVKEIRKTFSGPMIAASSLWSHRADLRKAGCDHEADKPAVPAKVLEILKLT